MPSVNRRAGTKTKHQSLAGLDEGSVCWNAEPEAMAGVHKWLTGDTTQGVGAGKEVEPVHGGGLEYVTGA